ncbi:hypothetical protein [Smaragdicoccus niigatensis]|uniref:hypothetical protein n=1 Tax=Smaragdicoccus niigatensis TaxID=359359 RepID=UPI0003A20264|nr:hypothetical protein [Smaragdicoccus niigatensis]
MVTPAASLALWTAEWRSGRCAPDDVVDAMRAWTPRHTILAGHRNATTEFGLPMVDTIDPALPMLLKILRAGKPVRYVRPVPGDPRGLPPGGDFAVAAMEIGEGLIAGDVGTVPVVSTDSIAWRVYYVGDVAVPDFLSNDSLLDAEVRMDEAISATTVAMAKTMAARDWRTTSNVRDLVQSELAESTMHDLPPSMPVRAQRILRKADHVAAILTVAQNHFPELFAVPIQDLRTQVRVAQLVAIHTALAGSP